MSVAAFASGVGALLAADATFQAALTALLGSAVTRVLDGVRPWEQVPTDLWPCFMVEAGDGQAADISNDGGDASGLSIGRRRQTFSSTVQVALIWQQDDVPTAAAQRRALPDLFCRLFLDNPQPGGVSGAWLESWDPDFGVAHPRQVFNATIRGEVAINRSA